MPQAGPKKNRIVRGADGALYLLGGGQAPRKLTPDETQKLTNILHDAEKEVSDRVKTQIPSMVEPCIFITHSESE